MSTFLLGCITSKSSGDLVTMTLPPFYIFIPIDRAVPALVTSKLDAPPQIFGDEAIPACLLDGAVYCLYLVPSLCRDDIGEIRGCEGLLGCNSRQVPRRRHGGWRPRGL